MAPYYFIVDGPKKPFRFSCPEKAMKICKTVLMAMPNSEYEKFVEDWIGYWYKYFVVDGE